MTRSRPALFTFALAVAAVALLSGPVFGQGFEELQGELTDAQCYGHHREEGFRSMDLYPDALQVVKAGEPFEFTMAVRNPWLHEVVNLQAFVNISKAPGFKFPGERDPFTFEDGGELGGPTGATTYEVALPVDANATLVSATVTGDPGALRVNDFDLFLVPPAGAGPYNATPDEYTGGVLEDATPWTETVTVGYGDLSQIPPGDWTLRVEYATDAGRVQAAPFSVVASVNYDLGKSTELRLRGPDVLGPKEDHTFSFQLIAPANAAGPVELVYGGMGIAMHLHTDPNAEDYGNYTKWNTLRFEVGDRLVTGQSAIVVDGPDPGPVMRSWGQILGFAGSFLLLPSLVLGGVFGHGTVRVMNRTMGGARRRVLWHNATSYLLLTTAVLHMFLFLGEAFWDWTHGMMWGGLSLAAMIGLGITGAFQRPLVALHGFNRWRFTHFTLGILVVLFVLIHLVADGTHISFAREWLG